MLKLDRIRRTSVNIAKLQGLLTPTTKDNNNIFNSSAMIL